MTDLGIEPSWPTLRIAAWNVRQLSPARASAVSDAATAIGADVIALSEWRPEADEILNERMLGNGFIHREALHTSLLPPSGVEPKKLGIVIYSRVPMTVRSTPPLAEAANCWLEVEIPSHAVTVAFVRLIDPPPKRLWPWIHDQAERLATEPAVIIGDLNVRSDRRKFKAVLERGWTDALDTGDPSEPRTFWGRSGGGGRPDHVLVSDQLSGRAPRAGVATRAGRSILAGARDAISDHATVWIEVQATEADG